MKSLAFAAVLLVVALVHPALAQSTAEVAVRNNEFDPTAAEVDLSGVVTWRLFEGEHTVTSDVPGLFDSGVMNAIGETFSFSTANEDAWIYYHCRVHGTPGDGTRRGAGMWGAIKVGDPPLPPSVEIEVRAVPSDVWPTLDLALTGLNDAGPTRVELADGTYRIEKELTPATLALGIPGQALSPRFELTIRGMGDSVVIEGGVAAALDGLRLENITITDASFAGILFWRGMQRWAIDYVDIPTAGNYGVRVERNARRGRIGDVAVSGARIAAISIASCVECDIVVDRVIATGSLAGLSALNAGSLVVQNSNFADNGVGIALKTSAGSEAPARGAHVVANTITNSMVRPAVTPPPSASMDIPVGAGIWLSAVSFATVESNVIAASTFGVVVTGPAYADRIVGNTVSGSVEADIAWGGLGANVCFSANAGPNGEPPSSMPPGAQTIYACSLPATVGMPTPLVDARLLAWGVAG